MKTKLFILIIFSVSFLLPGAFANIPPFVSISKPTNGTVIKSNSPIFIAANASDPDGSIAKVEFFVSSGSSNAKVGTQLYSPYEHKLSGLPAGTYTITAKAFDNKGATSSTSITITVSNSVTRAPYGGSSWSIPGKIEAENFDVGGNGVTYYDNTSSNMGGAYRNEGVDIQSTQDAGGGYNIGWIKNGEWLSYSIDVPNDGNYSFKFRVATPGTGKLLSAKIDNIDTAPLIIPSVTIPYTGGFQNWTTVSVNNISLTKGPKIMEVFMESDAFNLNYIEVTKNELPSVSITTPVSGATFTKGSNITISASASDSDGIISKVEFFNGTSKLGEDLTAPYSFNWTNVPAGNYTITAKATDNLGASSTSAPVSISVTSPVNKPPAVTIVSPSTGDSFEESSSVASVLITVNATDPDGSVKKVEFFSGDVKIGEKLSQTVHYTPMPFIYEYPSPYPGPHLSPSAFNQKPNTNPYLFTHSFTFSNASPGAHTLTVRATDDSGAVSISAPVHIIVTSETNDCMSSPTPSSSEFLVGNSWNDHTQGSFVTKHGDTIKVLHRAYGKASIALVQTGKTINLVSGKKYTFSFDVKFGPVTNPALSISSLELAFPDSLFYHNIETLPPSQRMTIPDSDLSSGYAKKTFTFTSSITRKVNPALNIILSSSPTRYVEIAFKNFSICETSSALKSSAGNFSQALQTGEDEIIINADSDMPVKVEFFNLQGKKIAELNGNTNENIFIGNTVTSGVYLVRALYGNEVNSFKIIRP